MALGFLIRELARPGRVSSRSTLGGASLGLILGLGLVCGGCDTGSFVPPRPPELGGGEAGPVTAAGAAPWFSDARRRARIVRRNPRHRSGSRSP